MANMFKIISRGLATSSTAMSSIKVVTVVGAGIMGSGIAQVFIFVNFKYLKLYIYLDIRDTHWLKLN